MLDFLKDGKNKKYIIYAVLAVIGYFIFHKGTKDITKLIETLGDQKILLIVVGLVATILFLKKKEVQAPFGSQNLMNIQPMTYRQVQQPKDMPKYNPQGLIYA